VPRAADYWSVEQRKRRQTRRLLCAGLIEVHWTGPGGEPRRVVANLDELSVGGACLAMDELDEMIPPGTRVLLGPVQQAVGAVVRHARRTELGWQMGVQFDAGQDAQALIGDISHILDPEAVPENPEQRKAAGVPAAVRGSIACLTLEEAIRQAEPKEGGSG
jgi:hypothetical protein